MIVEKFLIIFAQARSLVIMNETVNLEGTVINTFMQHKSRTKCATTNNSNHDLKIKGSKLGTFKSPSPQRLNRMLCASNRWETTKILTIIKIALYHTKSLTCAMIIYPWNKTKQINFPLVFQDIVS